MTIIQSLAIFFIGCFVILVVFLFAIWRDKRKTKEHNICDCKDVNQCEKWCNAKINYTKAQNKHSITEECKHPNVLTAVLASSVNCETTIEQCADCHEPLSEPKTECR